LLVANSNALRWIQRRVQKIQQRLKNIDKLFTWPLTEDALNVGLEWHASSFLLECWKDEEEENDAIRRAHQETARILRGTLPMSLVNPMQTAAEIVEEIRTRGRD